MTSADQRDHDAMPAASDSTLRLILGTVVSNGGDAAILHAQLRLLDRALGPAATVIEDGDPVLARELFPDVGVVEAGRVAAVATQASGLLRSIERPGLERVIGPLAHHRLPLIAQRGADAALDAVLARDPFVFYTGGTSLIEKYDLGSKFRHLIQAIDSGRPLVLLPQSVGPFTLPENIETMRQVVGGATLVLLRDERSYRHLHQIGADLSKVRVVPDVVFCLAGQADVDRLERSEIPERRPNVALGIRDCRKFFAAGDPDAQQAALVAQYVGLATRLVRERSARIRLVSTCQGIDRYWTDDSAVSREVFDLLPADVRLSCELDRSFHDTEGLRSVLRQQDLVVANRLHGAILALTAGVPVVPVEYEFKTREVFRQLGQEHAVYSIDETGERDLSAHVDAFIAGWAERRESAAAAFGTVVLSAWEAADAVRDAVAGR